MKKGNVGWLVLAGFILLAPVASEAKMMDGFYIEGTSTLNRDAWNLKSYLEFGSGAEAMTVGSGVSAGGSSVTAKVDSIRLPIEIRYGLSDQLEVGGDLAFETDDGTPDGSANYFDGSGLQRFRLYGKWNFWNDVAGMAELSFLGDKSLYYSSGSLDFGLKFIYGPQLGQGNLNLNLGVLFKNGTADFATGNPKITNSMRNYATVFSYGIGYVYPYSDRFTGVFEVAGSSSSFSGGSGIDFNDLLGFTMGGRYALTDRFGFEGGLGIGLGDGSPGFLLKVGMDIMWGTVEEYTSSGSSSSMRTEPSRSEPAQTTRPARTSTTETPAQAAKKSADAGGYYEPPPSRSAPTAPATTSAPAVAPAQAEPSGQSAEEMLGQYVTDASAAFQRGDYVSAVANYQSAIRLKSDDPVLHYNIATAYFQQKQYSDAKTYYKNAVTLNPSDVDSHLYLGYTYYYLQDQTGAAREWKKVLDLDPSNTLAKDNLQSLGGE